MISLQMDVPITAAIAMTIDDGRAIDRQHAHGFSRTQTQDIGGMPVFLEDVMRAIQVEDTHASDEMILARWQVQLAECRIRELEARLDQMTELLLEDPLTGSLNRRGLNDVLGRELARATRQSLPLCVAMIDLDDFKRLNDSHGHIAGDRALIHLVRIIKNNLRTMDVIARVGGDEFLVVLPDTLLEDAHLVVTRLQQELSRCMLVHNEEFLPISFSAGVAFRNPGEDQTHLIKHADNALYKAKRAGKNRVFVVD